MNIFNRYLKEGPGVSKDAPEKHRFFWFFELFGRKFSKLILLNIIYAITLLPLFIGLLMSLEINPQIFSNGNVNVNMLSKVPLIVLTGNITGLVILAASLFIAGPATAGFVYVIRNFQREEHSWVFSDFFEHFRKNFSQATAIAFLDVVVYTIMHVAICFYAYMVKDLTPELTGIAPILVALVVLCEVIFTWMHYYIYVMMVTFRLSIKDLLRNSLLFAVGKLPLNLFISIIVAAVAFVSMYYNFAGIIALFLITLSFVGYVITFSVYPTIDSYLIQPASKMDFDDDEE